MAQDLPSGSVYQDGEPDVHDVDQEEYFERRKHVWNDVIAHSIATYSLSLQDVNILEYAIAHDSEVTQLHTANSAYCCAAEYLRVFPS